MGMLRAAELARSEGYSGFIVEDREPVVSGGPGSTQYGHAMVFVLSNDSDAIPADETIKQHGPQFRNFAG